MVQTGASQRPAGSMTIIHKAEKRRGDASGGPAKPEGPKVDRKVANCLCCGKVYMLQDGSSSDAKRLIGACSYLARGWYIPCTPIFSVLTDSSCGRLEQDSG